MTMRVGAIAGSRMSAAVERSARPLRRGVTTTMGALSIVLACTTGGAFGAEHPLEPPDTRSPRGTIATLERAIDDAWEAFEREDPAFREALAVAVRCLDSRAFPAELAQELAVERALLLKEILDRIEVPPSAEIPGEAEALASDLPSWTIPHTEITLLRLTDGDRRGEFLFSAATVSRLPEFYARVRHLPYQPGKKGGHYDEVRSGALSPVVGAMAARLPAWTRREMGNQLVWQWGVALLCLAASMVCGFVAFRLGRRWAERERRSLGRARFSSFLTPLVVIVLSRFMQVVLARFLRLAGDTYSYGRLVFTAIADLAIAWIIALTILRIGEMVIRYSLAAERQLNAQLVRLSFRLVTIIVVGGYLFVAIERLGLPLPALLAGFGVGGLAVALATQGTLENLIGGLILYADQPVRVGELFRFGDRIGIVEEIGIRSVRIRTQDRTIVAMPNADLVKMQIENFSRRDRIRLRTTLRLPVETKPEQLRRLLNRLWETVQEHAQLSHEAGWARFVDLGQGSLDIELSVFAETTDWNEFLTIRQDVLLRVMSLVEEAGIRLVVPMHVELGASEGISTGDQSTAGRRRA